MPESTSTHIIQCGEIWGGIEANDASISTSGISASMFSQSCDGADSKGGDIYYFAVCDADMLTRVVVADVVGHGETVSQTSQWLYEALYKRMNSPDGAAVLQELNQLTTDFGLQSLSTAAIVGFYPSGNQLFYSYAGHDPLIVFRKSEQTWSLTESPRFGEWSGLPLGVKPEASYQQTQMPLQSGDKIFLYTDGVTEARDAHGEMFGRQRLLNVLNENSNAPIEAMKNRLIDGLTDYCGGSLDHDDVTFLAMMVE